MILPTDADKYGFDGEPTPSKVMRVGLMQDSTVWRLAAEISVLPLSQLQDENGQPTGEFMTQAGMIYTDRGGISKAPATWIAYAVLRILNAHHHKNTALLLNFWLPSYTDDTSPIGIFKTCDCQTIPCQHMIDAQKAADEAAGLTPAEIRVPAGEGLCGCDEFPYMHSAEWHGTKIALAEPGERADDGQTHGDSSEPTTTIADALSED
jgi:hypothetical protein